MKENQGQTKNNIRREFLQKRNRLTARQVEEWSRKICEHLLCREIFLKAETICFYYPLGNEVNLLRTAEEALRMGKQVAFPKTEGDRMWFCPVKNLSDFKEGNFHVMEPVGGEQLVDNPILILVPGVVFDRRKNRMGYGKGFYDRYLAEISKEQYNIPEGSRDRKRALNAIQSCENRNPVVTMGIAYECQLAETIPTEETDIPMDYILTEHGLY